MARVGGREGAFQRSLKYLAWPQAPGKMIKNQKVWTKRFEAAEAGGLIDQAAVHGLKATPHAVEAFSYWERAAFLQNLNLTRAGVKPTFNELRYKRLSSGDELQDSIPIYDTVNRRYAGFSNVLEQLWYGKLAPKYQKNLEAGRATQHRFHGTTLQWLYICLVHRMTGSGASFEHDHGWRNTIVPAMAQVGSLAQMAEFVKTHPGPSGTSIGNQFPAVSKTKPLDGARNHLQRYLATEGVELCKRFENYLELTKTTHQKLGLRPEGIKQAVQVAVGINSQLGQKRFLFQLTAWVMDVAEYYPDLIDPDSDCLHGKNAHEALNLCFQPLEGARGQFFFDQGTRVFCFLHNTRPYDYEDVLCDFIRWSENYCPKHGFGHITTGGVFNSSSIYHSKGRQPPRK